MSITKFRKTLESGPFLKGVLLVVAAIFVVGCFTMFGGGFFGGGPGDQQSDWAVKVNGEKISRETIDNQLERWSKQYEDANQGSRANYSDIAMFKGRLLSQAIMTSALRQAAEEKGIRVSGREVNDALDKAVKGQMDAYRQMVEQRLTKGKKKPTRDEIDRELEAMIRMRDKEATLRSFEEDIRNGFNREEMETNLVIGNLSKSLERSVTMSDRELLDSYRQVSASRIVISTKTQPDGQAKRKAEQIRQQIQAGADFAKLARDNSDDGMTKAKGGAFPFPLSSMMAQQFGLDAALTKAMFVLRPGQISDVIKTRDGYEIVKVTAEKSNVPPDFAKNKKQYMDQALQAKRTQVMAEFSDKAIKDAKIEVAPGDLKGYWLQQQAQDAMRSGDMKAAKANLAKAVKEFQNALQLNSGDGAVVYTLAQLYQATGEPKKALQLLELKLESQDPATANVDGPDLRILLGDFYASNKDNKRASEQYQIASSEGVSDEGVHQQLVEKFKKIGQPELAAKEKQWLDQAQAARAAQSGGVTPASAPAEPKR